MLERCHTLKKWYSLTLLIGFIISLSIYTVLLPGTYILLQIEPAYKLSNITYTYPIEELALDDYTRLVDITNFQFTIFNKACNNETTLLLILIHSSPGHFDKRQVIRQTWGRQRREIKLLFALGTVKNETLQNQIIAENEIYHDIIQGIFLDAYHNLTYKHVMVLKYAVYHCPDVKYILKTDDDVFVNVDAMITFIRSVELQGNVQNLLLCKVIKYARVFRGFRSKWRVPYSEYPNKYYPNYCMGFAILYSNDVLFELYKNVQKSKYFWIDDVHITGNTVVGTNISHTDVSPLVIDAKHVTQYNVNHFLYGKPQTTIEEILRLWKSIEINSNDIY